MVQVTVPVDAVANVEAQEQIVSPLPDLNTSKHPFHWLVSVQYHLK